MNRIAVAQKSTASACSKKWSAGDWACAVFISCAALYLCGEVLVAFLSGAIQQAVR